MRILLVALSVMAFWSCQQEKEPRSDSMAKKYAPNDHFFQQRAYPDASINLKAFTRALEDARFSASLKNDFPGFDREWIGRGPANIGARVNTIAVHPTDENIIYAGFSTGGVFKTTDGGLTWHPIFDDQLFLAIGDITLDPADPETIYVGTGDPNIGGYVQIGDGLYKVRMVAKRGPISALRNNASFRRLSLILPIPISSTRPLWDFPLNAMMIAVYINQ